MNKLNPKPIDIINAAVSEIYGKKAIELLTLFSMLNDKGQQRIIEYTDEYSEITKFTKAIHLG